MRLSPRSLSMIAALALISADPVLAQTDSPQTAQAKPRQLAVGMTCADAQKAIDSGKLSSLTPEERQEVYLDLENCAVAENNKAKPNDPQVTVVGPDPSGKDTKVFFKTIRASDLDAVNNICSFSGKQLFAATEMISNIQPAAKAGVVGLDIITDKGAVACNAYIQAMKNDNGFIVLAPGLISGTAITVKVLNMIGLGRPAQEIQKSMDDLGKKVGNELAKTASDVQKQPTLLLPGTIGDVVRLNYVAQRLNIHVQLPPPPKVPCTLQIKCSGFHCENMCN